MQQLRFGESYSRLDIRNIFAPLDTFIPGSGDWGLSGAIRIKPTRKNSVFIVSHDNEHSYNDSITNDGVLTWVSQNYQKLHHARIRQWINHDSTKADIHFFIRPNKKVDYTYLGKLNYLSHDPTKENPVRFQFQLLDWDPQLVPDSLRGSKDFDHKPTITIPYSSTVKNMKRDKEISRLRNVELMTLSAIAKRFGLSQERVRVIAMDSEEAIVNHQNNEVSNQKIRPKVDFLTPIPQEEEPTNFFVSESSKGYLKDLIGLNRKLIGISTV